MYVKYFVYSKCSIVTGCIVIITITWNLVTSCECLFSLLSHTWKGASENQNVMCKYGPRFSNFFFFLFVRPGWIHSPSYLPEWLFHTCLLTLHKLLSLPSPFHSQVIVFLHFAEAIEAIKNGFPEAPITTSIHTISCVWMLLRE